MADGLPTSEDLLATAYADPRRAWAEGVRHLASLDDDVTERIKTLRVLSIASRLSNDLAASIEFAREGASIAARVGNHELEMLCRLTLVGSQAQSGDLASALKTIDEVIASEHDATIRAKFTFQRGFVLGTMGDLTSARDAYLEALQRFETEGDTQAAGMALHNLGDVHTQLGEFKDAEAALGRALEIEERHGERSAIAGLEHNLGRLSAYQGDIPGALEHLMRSDRLYMEVSGAIRPQHVTRAEVLITAGLFDEGQRLAIEVAHASRDSQDLEHAGNALLVAAAAALLAGRFEEATSIAGEALTVIDQEGSKRLDAERILIEARFASGDVSAELLERARHVASQLEDSGQLVASSNAGLLVGRMALELGQVEVATEQLSRVAASDRGPIELQIDAWLAKALTRRVLGDRRGAATAVRSGLRLLDRYQAAVGATDLRLGLEKRGREIGEMGLELALEGGQPRRVLDALERARARALRYRTVTPADDDNVQALLSRLRQIDAEMRRPENRGDAARLTQRRQIQDEIAAFDRIVGNARLGKEGFSIEVLLESLTGTNLLEFGVCGGRLILATTTARRVHIADVGPIEPVLAEMRQVRFAFRRAARRSRSIDAEALRTLDALLFAESRVSSEAVLVVPPPELLAIPWSAMPTLASRRVSVAPSAEMWWRQSRKKEVAERVVVVGGPDLVVAVDEVAAIKSLYSTSRVVGARLSGVVAALDWLDGAAIAHFACHASFSYQNPMFSSLRLADGDLNVYDIERLRQAPEVVVLSACDSGYTETRAGDELAGMTSALLSMGTKSVIASVGLVPDSVATTELMVDLHKGLVAGLTPSEALAAAQATAFQDPERFVSAASFICVGA